MKCKIHYVWGNLDNPVQSIVTNLCGLTSLADYTNQCAAVLTNLHTKLMADSHMSLVDKAAVQTNETLHAYVYSMYTCTVPSNIHTHMRTYACMYALMYCTPTKTQICTYPMQIVWLVSR